MKSERQRERERGGGEKGGGRDWFLRRPGLPCRSHQRKKRARETWGGGGEGERDGGRKKEREVVEKIALPTATMS